MGKKVKVAKVAIVKPEHEHVASVTERGKFRGVLPVELCAHEHDTLQEAIECGAPTAVVLSAVLHEIGKSILKKAGEER